MLFRSIVTGLPDNGYSITNENMTRGIVVGIDGNMIKVRIQEHEDANTGAFTVNFSGFEVIGHVKPFDRKEAIARLRGGDKSELLDYNLSKANMRKADMREADMSWANLSGANLSRADMSGANLSGATGLKKASDFLAANFEKAEQGYVVYKTFGEYWSAPESWAIEPNSIIEENVDTDRCRDCGCGVNVATLDWVKAHGGKRRPIWKCLIEWAWLPDVCVPYNSDGKIRAGRVRLLEVVEATT